MVFRGERRGRGGSVVARRVSRGNYSRLTANRGGGGGGGGGH